MTIEERDTARAIQNIGKKLTTIDWEQRRYEIAKDLFPVILIEEKCSIDVAAKISCQCADTLIKELKQTQQ